MKYVSKEKQQKRLDKKEARRLAKGKECKKCGECCKALYFHIPDLTSDIKYYYMIHENTTVEYYNGKAFVRIEARCRQLTSDNLCEIHDKGKPFVCRNGYSKTRKNVVFMEGCAFK